MSHTTSIRRSASILGATGLIALSIAGPASARQVPGNGDWADQHCSVNCYEGPSGSGGGATIPTTTIDDNGVEVLQLGAGLLAGLALAGAGAAAFSRRTHSHSHAPA